MLRCFGGMITELEYDYSRYDRIRVYQRIINYIHEFCSESLIKATLYLDFGFEGFKKPFINVIDLSINFANGVKEKFLSRLIPNVKCLNFISFDDETLPFASEYFPKLHHLEFGDHSDSVVDILRSNPKLRSLTIEIDDFLIFKGISERYLHSLETIFVEDIIHNVPHETSIHLPNVRKFGFYYDYFEGLNVELSKIPFSFNQLRQFEVKSHSLSSDIFLQFFNENQAIESIIFNSSSIFRLVKTGQLQEALPNLKYFIVF